jgi:hypothetical protein
VPGIGSADVEGMRITELPRIAVGRGDDRDDRLSGGDADAADVRVRPRPSGSQLLQRSGPAQDLFGGGCALADDVGPQPVPLR